MIIHLDSSANKSKIREALKIFKGVTSVSDKITLTDIETLADEALVREMKKADKTQLLSYDEGAKEFEKIKNRLRK